MARTQRRDEGSGAMKHVLRIALAVLVTALVSGTRADVTVFFDDFNDGSGVLSNQTANTGQAWTESLKSGMNGGLDTGAAFGQGSTVGAGKTATGTSGLFFADQVPIGRTVRSGVWTFSIDLTRDVNNGPRVGFGLANNGGDQSSGGYEECIFRWDYGNNNLICYGDAVFGNPDVSINTGVAGGSIHVDIEFDLDPTGTSSAQMSYYEIGNPANNGTVSLGTETGLVMFDTIFLLVYQPNTHTGEDVGYDNVSLVLQSDMQYDTLLFDDFNDDSGLLKNQTATTGQSWTESLKDAGFGRLDTGAAFGQGSTVGAGKTATGTSGLFFADQVPIGQTVSSGFCTFSLDLSRDVNNGPRVGFGLANNGGDQSSGGYKECIFRWDYGNNNLICYGNDLFGDPDVSINTGVAGGSIHLDVEFDLDPTGTSSAQMSYYQINNPANNGSVSLGTESDPVVFDTVFLLVYQPNTHTGEDVGYDNVTFVRETEPPVPPTGTLIVVQ